MNIENVKHGIIDALRKTLDSEYEYATDQEKYRLEDVARTSALFGAMKIIIDGLPYITADEDGDRFADLSDNEIDRLVVCMDLIREIDYNTKGELWYGSEGGEELIANTGWGYKFNKLMKEA